MSETPGEVKHRAEQAERILNDKVFREACQAIKKQYTDRWITCDLRDTEGMMLMLVMVQTVDKFQTVLQTYVQDGQVALAEQDWQDRKDKQTA